MKKGYTSLSRLVTLCITLTFILSSCSSEYHLRKAIAKDPSILQPKQIHLIDTVVITPIARVDTLAYFATDTITIEKERVRVQIRRIDDTLRVSAECLPDTIRITKTVKLPSQIKYAPRKWWERVTTPILVLLVVAFFARRIFDRWANNS